MTFPFVPNGKWCLLGVSIFKHITIRLQCAQILGHLKIINFPFGTNGKFIILGVPILKHIRVSLYLDTLNSWYLEGKVHPRLLISE